MAHFSEWRRAFASPTNEPLEALKYCGRLGPDDLVDPRHAIDSIHEGAKHDRKTAQLCAAVRRVIEQLLGGETANPLLAGCQVVDVLPDPNASRLRVLIQPEDGQLPAAVLAALAGASGWMRSEVAGSIRRRKTPDLSFSLAQSSDEMRGGA